MLQVSRASAQRLVSLCLAERLITFAWSTDCGLHGVSGQAEGLLSPRLLWVCRPTRLAPLSPPDCRAAANILESTLRARKPTILLGQLGEPWGRRRTLSPIDCPNTRFVSLVGNSSADGSASFFDTVGRPRTEPRRATIRCRCVLMCRTVSATRCQIEPIAKVRRLRKADLRLVGIGQMDQQAQSTLTVSSRARNCSRYAAGRGWRTDGWAFDDQGHIIDGGTNLRLTSIPPRIPAVP